MNRGEAKPTWLALGQALLGPGEYGGDEVSHRRALAASTGVSDALLRRYARRVAYVARLERRGSVIDPERLAGGFAAIEVIERLEAVDPAVAATALRDWSAGTIKVRALRALLAAATRRSDGGFRAAPQASPHQVAAIDRVDRRDLVRDAVADLLPTLSGRGFKLLVPAASGATIRCAMLSEGPVRSGTRRERDGFDTAYLPGRATAAEVQDVVARANLLASLFRRFWIVLPPGTDGDAIAAVVRALDWVDAASVGVVAWTWAGDDAGGGKRRRPTVVRPADGLPVPDRRGLLQDILVDGEWRPIPPKPGTTDATEPTDKTQG